MSIDATKARQLAAQAGRGHLKSIRELLNMLIDEVDPFKSIVSLAVSTSLSARTHGNKTILMSGAGAARTFTLPAATGTGDKYRFVVAEVNTSNYVITVTGDDTIDGSVIFDGDEASDVTTSFSTASNTDTITLNGTTKGGVSIGDWVELQDIATDQWSVTGILTESGVEVTPFSGS